MPFEKSGKVGRGTDADRFGHMLNGVIFSQQFAGFFETDRVHVAFQGLSGMFLEKTMKEKRTVAGYVGQCFQGQVFGGMIAYVPLDGLDDLLVVAGRRHRSCSSQNFQTACGNGGLEQFPSGPFIWMCNAVIPGIHDQGGSGSRFDSAGWKVAKDISIGISSDGVETKKMRTHQMEPQTTEFSITPASFKVARFIMVE